ncbi:MAG: molybdopterin-binding protein [Marinilabiliales bacterium]|nr:molybdopterin-binding protein [Marinilabiliales bacterium]
MNSAEIITIGDELLIGQTVDTNSAWMGTELNLIGIRVNRITSISDSREEIISALVGSLGTDRSCSDYRRTRARQAMTSPKETLAGISSAAKLVIDHGVLEEITERLQQAQPADE